jgi:hypothetical protein
VAAAWECFAVYIYESDCGLGLGMFYCCCGYGKCILLCCHSHLSCCTASLDVLRHQIAVGCSKCNNLLSSDQAATFCPKLTAKCKVAFGSSTHAATLAMHAYVHCTKQNNKPAVIRLS